MQHRVNNFYRYHEFYEYHEHREHHNTIEKDEDRLNILPALWTTPTVL